MFQYVLQRDGLGYSFVCVTEGGNIRNTITTRWLKQLFDIVRGGKHRHECPLHTLSCAWTENATAAATRFHFRGVNYVHNTFSYFGFNKSSAYSRALVDPARACR